MVAPLVIGIILRKVKSSFIRNTIVCAVIAATLSGVCVAVLKKQINRPRPTVYFQKHPYVVKELESAPDDFPSEALYDTISVHLVGRSLKYNSFPSGHSATAFTGAAILVYLFGGWYWLSFAVAGLVAYSRIYVGVHYPLDVSAGAVLAIAIVWTTLHLCSYFRVIPKRGEFV